MTPPKKKKFPEFWLGVLLGLLWFTVISFAQSLSSGNERIDNDHIPFAITCVDGMDVMFYGHKKPTFMCTKYVRNNIPLETE